MEKRIYIRVPEQLLKDFDAACKANYTTKSEVLRRAMLEYVRGNKKEDIRRNTIMAKKLSYQVLEDNGGGLHLAVFSGDECIYYASGLEHLPVADVQEMFQALRDGAHPVDEGWESDLPDGYTPQQLYDELTSYEYGWEIIADDAGVYPERMGAAGRTAFQYGRS